MKQQGKFFNKSKWPAFFASLLVMAILGMLFYTAGASPINRYSTEITSAMLDKAERDASWRYKGSKGFTITVLQCHGAYQQGDRLKVFFTAAYGQYFETSYGIKEIGSGIMPASIEYRVEQNGGYTTLEYSDADLSTSPSQSIQNLCKLPNGQKIKGLAEKIIKANDNNETLASMLNERLAGYMESHGLESLRVIPANENQTFKATVISVIGNNMMMVKPEPDSVEFKAAELIRVHISKAKLLNSNNQAISAFDLEDGNKAIIVYDGLLEADLPGDIKNCFSVTMLSNQP